MTYYYSDGLVDFVAGWCSGGAAVVLCQPVDTILTRYQAGAGLLAKHASTINNINATYKLGSLVSTAGVASLWRGSLAMIGAVPLQNALLMSGYGLGKRWALGYNADEREEEPVSNAAKKHILMGVFVGGCTGGVIQSLLMTPVELLKVQQQVQLRGPVATAVWTYQHHLGAFRGLNATLLRDGIPHGVWFVSYEVCKEFLQDKYGEKQQQQHEAVTIPLVSGAFAATVAWGVGYPADLIKTRIQAGGTKGIWDTAMELRNEPGGLYRGFGLKLVRAVPASMIGFVVYEFVKDKMTAI